jgi:hypothetical protein
MAEPVSSMGAIDSKVGGTRIKDAMKNFSLEITFCTII